MKIIWKKEGERGKKRSRSTVISPKSNLPFETKEKEEEQVSVSKTLASDSRGPDTKQLADSFQSQGNLLAEDGRYREALGKWEAALNLTPEKAVLHEQKAQILLELGDAWNALRAATRATELEPSWAEAWITLARAQLNFGEPDASIESFDRALSIKPDCEEAQVDREAALKLVKKRKQLHLSGLSVVEGRFEVKDRAEIS